MQKKIREFCMANKWMIVSFLLVWLCLLVFSFIYSKIQTHLMLNGLHTTGLDIFFKYITIIGEWFPVGVGVVLLVWTRRGGFLILLSQGLTALITQGLKFVFAAPRPATYFDQKGVELPPTVPGETTKYWNSFPSGHTSAAFALFTCLALMTPRKWAPLWMTAAWAVAYSRIYLSHHFLEDILFGSVIGMISSCAVYLLMERYYNNLILNTKI